MTQEEAFKAIDDHRARIDALFDLICFGDIPFTVPFMRAAYNTEWPEPEAIFRAIKEACAYDPTRCQAAVLKLRDLLLKSKTSATRYGYIWRVTVDDAQIAGSAARLDDGGMQVPNGDRPATFPSEQSMQLAVLNLKHYGDMMSHYCDEILYQLNNLEQLAGMKLSTFAHVLHFTLGALVDDFGGVTVQYCDAGEAGLKPQQQAASAPAASPGAGEEAVATEARSWRDMIPPRYKEDVIRIISRALKNDSDVIAELEDGTLTWKLAKVALSFFWHELTQRDEADIYEDSAALKIFGVTNLHQSYQMFLLSKQQQPWLIKVRKILKY